MANIGNNLGHATEALLDELRIGDSAPDFSNQERTAQLLDNGWTPRLNKPTQAKAYKNLSSKFKIYHGPRGSGKSIGAMHEAVKHAFNNDRAIVVIITQTSGQAIEGGTWFKLNEMILPEWGAPPEGSETLTHPDGSPVCGVGLEYSQPKMDPVTRKQFVWVANRFGTHSRIVFISLPVDGKIESRVKGYEPSFAVVDEAQNFKTNDVFKFLIQQIGRHPFAKGPQQALFCCNPDGPSHWLYKTFFVHPVDEETGEWNEDYAEYFFPIKENIQNLPEGYYDNVMAAVKGDPIEEARMLRGEWIDAPSGEAIFGASFSKELHVRGDALKGVGLLPSTDFPILVGYDLGPAHSSIHFMQYLIGADRHMWLVFDELNFVEKRFPYSRIVPQLLKRMDYWNERLDHNFHFEHISDDSAFNQLRPDGSLDHQTVEQLSKGRIKMKAAPKGKGSVLSRTRILLDVLASEEIIISATCPKTIDMLMFLESNKEKKGEYDPDARFKPKRCKHLHVFDSLTYPMIKLSTINPLALPSQGKVSPSKVSYQR